MNKGIVRNLDELGRIVLPIEMRRSMGIGENAPLAISLEGETITISKADDSCVFCGDAGYVLAIGGKRVCLECAERIKNAMV